MACECSTELDNIRQAITSINEYITNHQINLGAQIGGLIPPMLQIAANAESLKIVTQAGFGAVSTELLGLKQTQENQSEILQDVVDNLFTIAQKTTDIRDVLTVGLDGIGTHLQNIQTVLQNIQTVFAPIVGTLSFIAGNTGALQDISDKMTTIAGLEQKENDFWELQFLPALPGGLPALISAIASLVTIVPVVIDIIQWLMGATEADSIAEIADTLQKILDAIKAGELQVQGIDLSVYNDASRNTRLDFASIRRERESAQLSAE